MKRFTYILLVLFLMASYSVRAEGDSDNAGSKGTIAGRILDADHLPLPEATVVIEKLNKGAVTDVNGFYRIVSLNPGEYTVKVTYIGFKETSKAETVTAGKTVELNFELEAGILYLGEEVAGIHKFSAEPEGSSEGKFIALSSEENPNINYDIEGLTIHPTDSVNGYLIASSQGNYSYAVFERQGDNRYVGNFRIIDGNVDGVEETDGIDVSNVPIATNYPKGIFVVQDGYNYDGNNLLSQNYKLVSWEKIEQLFKAKN